MGSLHGELNGQVIARGESLTRSGQRFPMTRLFLDGVNIRREDRWPEAADQGNLVILPGGEVGTLLEWWNAADGSEWRGEKDVYNCRSSHGSFKNVAVPPVSPL